MVEGIEDLMKTREIYRELADTEGDAIIILDSKGKFVFLNKEVEIKTGYTESELIGKVFTKLLTKPSVLKALSTSRKALSGARVNPYEIEIKKKDGSIIPVEVQATPIKRKGKVIGFLVIARDLTERKKVEEELRIKESAIKSSIDAIAMSDLNGNLTYVNPSFLKMWGYDNEKEVLGKPAVGFWQTEEKASEVVVALRDTGSWKGELVAKKKDGSMLYVQLLASMTKDENGKPISMMSSFIDTTARKRAEEELKKKTEELEKSKKELEAKIHDLERFSKMSVGRELKMVELKKRIKELKNGG